VAQLRENLGTDQRRRDGHVVAPAVHIGAQLRKPARFIGGTVPDEVEATLAGTRGIGEARDRVAEHHLARRQAEDELVDQLAVDRQGKGALLGKAAPADVAGVVWARHGRELGAHA
jgi:hypothetical protein